MSESEVGRALRTDRWKYYVHAPDAGDVPAADQYVERAWYDLTADPYELDNLAGVPASQPVLEQQRTRLRELCSPVPPGFGDRSGTSVPIGLAVLGGLVLVEALASRRKPGASRGSSIR